ncbi:MAG: type III-B CRISPR-associated protein Cas10/Cmr2 [Aggregatilineales bacterium]
MTTHLYLFAIGPVQAFIAQARRTQDLYMGSRMLSALAAAGILEAQRSANFKPIFPVPQQGHAFSAQDDLKGAPHRFAFLSDDAAPHQLAKRVEGAIRGQWRTQFAQKVETWLRDRLGDGEWVEMFQRQAYDWLEFYWVAVRYESRNHAGCFKKANEALAQRKHARFFPQIEEPRQKCTLTGIQSALPFTEHQRKRLTELVTDIVIRENERLGALALIKRLAGHPHAKCFGEGEQFKVWSTTAVAYNRDADSEELERRASEPGEGREVVGYFAVLHMDGDRMGRHLSELASLEAHQDFSRKLSKFAAEVSKIVKKNGGEGGLLIYSGGDDVLTLLPLRHALLCAYALYQKFNEITDLTASAGIAITPSNFPLETALQIARQAEESAKEGYGRNAVVFTEAHGTGQLRSAGAKWEVVPFLGKLQELFQAKKISAKLGYELQAIDHDLRAADVLEARKAEICRIAKRRTAEGVDFETEVKPTIEEMIKLVEEPYPDSSDDPKKTPKPLIPSWADMANWAILLRFLATDPEERQT